MELLLELQKEQCPIEAAGIPWPPHPSASEGGVWEYSHVKMTQTSLVFNEIQ